MDPLTVLVRETAQNSWDARLDNDKPVGFSIDGWFHTETECDALRNEIFVDARNAKGTNLDEVLNTEPLLGLYISDRNTKGLSGPLLADEADPDNTYDWVDFVLNVGKANTQGHTGGTYGFGKTISYVVSSANAVVIHSRTRYRGRAQSRLIACAIGEEFTRNRRLYTGRHWWGERDVDTPLPVTGRTADQLAERIGMPLFGPSETGTNILVVAPDFGGRTPEQAMRFIAESVTWHLWPKMIEHKGKRPMHISVSWNGDPVTIAHPEQRPPLQGFAQAFRAIIADNNTRDDAPAGLRIDTIRAQRPSTVIGKLATVPLVHRNRAEVDDGSNPDDPEAPAPAAAIPKASHHIALLRSPELVIDYLEGPAPPEGGTEWAGVFRAEDEHDAYFAAAEPPTHDSWIPSLLPKSKGRTIVNVGLREIRLALERRWAPRKRHSHDDGTSTAVIADQLAHLVKSVEGKGRGKHHKDGPSGPPGPAKPRVDIVFAAPLQLEDGLGTVARVRINPAPRSHGTRLHVNVAAALDGKDADRELDPELQLVEARFEGTDKSMEGLSEVLTLEHSKPVEVDLIVRRGAETTVLFDLDAERV
ncbi:hypothetical protein ABQE48_22815 [Mycolicibacterium thermoresistibile]